MTTTIPKLNVNEIFGPTIQGEGTYAGMPAVFVRLNLCNLRCSWCDTPYTWSFTEAKAAAHRDHKAYDFKAESHHMSPMAVSLVVRELAGPCIVVVSGGEPLLQSRGLLAGNDSPPSIVQTDLLGELAQTLKNAKYRVHIETAGTKLPGVLLHNSVDHYTVSPKLQSSGNTKHARYRPDVLDFFALQSRATFKFVITNKYADQDVGEVDKLVTTHHIPPGRVMLMPEGITPFEVIDGMRTVTYRALERGYGVSSRLHVLVWGDERGH